jgi:septal ring factor EnvC (AmiA/AmiB activator)
MSTEQQLSNTTAVETTPTEAPQSLQQTLHSLVELAANQAQLSRDMHRNLKRLAVEVEKVQKKLSKTKPRRVVVQKPVSVVPDMLEFLKGQQIEPVDGGHTRQVLMRAVSGYIKTQKLQVEENKKQWKPDTTLVKLFSLDKKQLYTFMNINGLLSRAIQSPTATA